MDKHRDISYRLDQLTELSMALSNNRDLPLLLERILLTAMDITQADGGTLYRIDESDNSLQFYISVNGSLKMHQGGSSGTAISIPNIALRLPDGAPNLSAVAAYAANTRKSVNIPDVYQAQESTGFNFNGMRMFDEKYGYRSQSILTVPMQDHSGELLGVLQLINATDRSAGKTIAFSETDQHFIEALASQASIAMTNQQLIHRLENLFESFIKLINIGIGEKSPHTGRHCEHVPELAMMIAEAAHAATEGPLADFRMTEADRRELWVAGLLHDCGKISSPTHIVEKSTKMETIFDRIHLIDTRFEVLKRDAEIGVLQEKLALGAALTPEKSAELDARLQAEIALMDDERAFLHKSNIGTEGMKPEDQKRVLDIAERQWRGPDGRMRKFLDEEEAGNLRIRAGTLNDAERQIINNHIVITIKMLESLPWPKQLRNVTEYAGGHHERMDGKGYPKGLTREQMSIPARIMAVADIFEAVTAADRPYKRGNTLSEAVEILAGFRARNHIDPDLFDIFIRNKVYQQYADKFMHASQIDEVDLSKIPGYGG
ncbi:MULTISPECIES: HD family phosphohydrolase [unclassified Herbaspirillum]|uniref:HD family phosphohydrolase n=1 Tax=unclassified Herbaspirillum TaxID=2624150 RepID=UPI00114FDD02|nr:MULTISPECIES: HD family phosphohydrolase [unclassified Herbaspirillum]MBB5392714.1 HD-GYP domain-containing protein (c-di-GMP phosphodiesterase class II) [Herbaspirillum sp. SJZ102]TQJ99113.1 HD domain-containing protein [Herbaspirillum sp. SJZ130]TQK04126.1 HD domain-containing protein [Herbaspirillum sp. SJZ106]